MITLENHLKHGAGVPSGRGKCGNIYVNLRLLIKAGGKGHYDGL